MKHKRLNYFISYAFAFVSFAGIIAILLTQSFPERMGLYDYVPLLSMWIMLGVVGPILYGKGFEEGRRKSEK